MRNVFALLLSLMALVAFAQDTPPKVSLKLDKTTGAAGSTLKGTVTIEFLDNLHGYQNPQEDKSLIPIEVVAGDKITKIVKVEYPKGIDMKVLGFDKPIKVYEGTIKIPVTFKLPDAVGAANLKISVKYQQCNESNCFPPGSKDLSAKVTVSKKNGEEPSEEPELVASTGGEPAKPAATTPPAPEDDSFVARLLREGFEKKSYLWILLGSLLTGLALTLTPCVYPVIPVTISFFSSQTSGSRSGRVGLGLMYMLGIGVTYGAVGGVAASLGGAVGDLFKKSWFLFALAIFMVALALSMFDVYQIGIPGPIAKHLKGRSGALGALIMGLMVGVAAAPCAGALVSSVAIEVARIGSVPIGLLVFTTIGLGIGLPFVVIGAMSQGAKALPKSGGWLKTVKSVLGIVVLWIAADYFFKGLGFKPEEPRTLVAWTIFYFGAAVYLLGFDNSGNTRIIFGIKGAAVLALGLLMGQAMTTRAGILKEEEFAKLAANSGGKTKAVATKVEWVKFTPEAFEEAKKSGKPILIDGTADWCLVCKEIDEAVFKKPAAIIALQDVVTMKIDLSTGVDPAYDEAVRKQFNIVGLPHIMLFKPGGEQIRTFSDLKQLPNPDVLVAALKEAGATL